MANQPVGRPWFLRLASQARIDPPAPPAQPQPAQPPPASPVRQASLAFDRTPLLSAQAPPPPPPSPVPTQPSETPQPTQTTNTATPSPPEVPKPATTPMLQRVASPRPVTAAPVANPSPVTAAPVANPSPPSRADAAYLSPPEVPKLAPSVSAPAATPMLQRLASPRLAATAPITNSPPPPPIPVTAATRSPPPPQYPKVINSSSASLVPQPEPDPIAVSQPKRTIEQNSSNKNPDKKPPSFPTKAEAKNSATANENGSTTKSKDQGETRAITIAGQNMGAFLDLSPSYGLQHQIRKQQVRPTVGDTWFKDLNNGAHKEGKPAKESNSNSNSNNNKQQQKPMISLVNSNVQSVNNSLMLNASCDQGSPGVHIKLTRKRSGKNGEQSLH